jgi:propanol-preferring alcohol dehydrogenase
VAGGDTRRYTGGQANSLVSNEIREDAMPNMRAVVLEQPRPLEQNPLRVTEIPRPEPGPGEVLVRVAACGVCRSNLHMIEGDWIHNNCPAKTPIVPGHEIVGRVEVLGPDVTGLARGDRVGIQPLWSSCGLCRYCMSGREQLCQTKQMTGETLDGGYADYVLAAAAHAYRVPQNISDAEAAPLFCPGITAYGSVKKAEPAPGKRVALFGMGGVGHMVLQLLRLYGADAVVVARSARHLDLARRLGAARVVDASKGDAGEALRRDGGVDAAIVFAPSTPVMAQAMAATRPGGTVVVGAFVDIGAFFFPDEKRVVGSILGSRQEMKDLLELAGRGLLKTVCETHPLERAGEALRRLKSGELEARAVLVTG